MPISSKTSSTASSITTRLVLAALVCFFSTTLSAQTYRVLLSNDDGIESPLLVALHQELVKLPDVEVVVSAPNINQSGSSQSSIGSVSVDRYFLDGSFFGYAVHGRPADAVRFAVVELGKDSAFDLVVSGINRGANVGDVSHLSGTIGAAMEGLYQGIPAIAVSQDTQGVDTQATAKFTAMLVAKYQRDGAPEGTLISINIPRGELKGVSVRPMGDSYLKTESYETVEQNDNQTVYERELIIVSSEDSSTDTYAYQQGYITITPLKFDWTDYELLSEVESWDLRLVD
ncbi:MAG: 5'/3'-nucleotidase SurE [SAR86 cluster bacterium]|uniref:5'-nucleotidase SurE n=1 Tax=SAR86 cluster bacterium TaxID=2030880 RepID=A0A2A5B0Y3_9GAMM|nr:MAG: 5'/3'-nucleotidase SurE [SAR86 cluster bacterium]